MGHEIKPFKAVAIITPDDKGLYYVTDINIRRHVQEELKEEALYEDWDNDRLYDEIGNHYIQFRFAPLNTGVFPDKQSAAAFINNRAQHDYRRGDAIIYAVLFRPTANEFRDDLVMPEIEYCKRQKDTLRLRQLTVRKNSSELMWLLMGCYDEHS